jgi:hypothetical protein
MRRLTVLAALTTLIWLGDCGPPVESASASPGLGALPTSPAGGADDASATLPVKLILRARQFRGNPTALGGLAAGVLLVAAGLGVYTLRVAYRRSPGG